MSSIFKIIMERIAGYTESGEDPDAFELEKSWGEEGAHSTVMNRS